MTTYEVVRFNRRLNRHFAWAMLRSGQWRRLIGWMLTALAIVGCPPPAPPAPFPPDASDAAPPNPPLAQDAGTASGDCVRACARMVALGCVLRDSCAAAEQRAQDRGLIRLRDAGALRCADIAAARDMAALGEMGIHCGP